MRWWRRELGQATAGLDLRDRVGHHQGFENQGDDYREVAYLRVANVQRLRLDLSEVKTIPARDSAIASYHLEPGDILLNEGGDRDKLGRGWIWQGQISECIHQNHVFSARIRDGKAIPKWVAYYANTDEARAYFLATGKQTTNLASISKKNLSALPVPLPPVDIQEAIVAEIDTQLSRVDETITTLQAIRAKLKQARASILKEAVDGKLVVMEQQPALARSSDPSDQADHTSEKTLPNRWDIHQARAVCTSIESGTTPNQEYLSDSAEGNVPFVKVYNLTFTGRLDFQENRPAYVGPAEKVRYSPSR